MNIGTLKNKIIIHRNISLNCIGCLYMLTFGYYKKALLDYKPFVFPKFLFLIQIPGFYVEYLSLYTKVSMLLFKRPAFNS